jgi:cysteinyl-tRNA synthetase
LTKRVEAFVPADPGRVTFYTCGPTVYDDAHIGNFRSFLAADVLRRFIESPLCVLQDGEGGEHRAAGGRRVVHVMNITDVGHMTDDAAGGEAGEDRMAVAGRRLLEAKKQGKLEAGVDVDPKDPRQIARYFEGRFREDAKKLGLKLVLEAEGEPGLMPRATEHVAGMIKVIERLIARGCAYVVGEVGNVGGRVVYFSVQRFPAYGALSGNTLDKLREGAGGRVSGENQSGKRHPADFLLWKEDASHIMKWESPWGWGYPGWHIECSVMSVEGTKAQRHKGTEEETDVGTMVVPDAESIIDLHSGGEDNIFPHHECEIAQSCCAFNAEPDGATYARMWFHPRFLLVEGEKMSKSKGNFFTARDLFARGHEPAAVRLELIKTHYRSNANFTEQGLTESAGRIQEWRKTAKLVMAVRDREWLPIWGIRPDVAEIVGRFAARLAYDLNVAGAIAAMDGLANHTVIGSAAMNEIGIKDYDELQLFLAQQTLPSTPLDAHHATQSMDDGRSKGTFEEVWGAMHLMDSVLGCIFVPVAANSAGRSVIVDSEIGMFIGIDPSPEVEAKLRERRAARAAKDFATSDRIRDELGAMGYAIKDAKDGKVEVRRK